MVTWLSGLKSIKDDEFSKGSYQKNEYYIQKSQEKHVGKEN